MRPRHHLLTWSAIVVASIAYSQTPGSWSNEAPSENDESQPFVFATETPTETPTPTPTESTTVTPDPTPTGTGAPVPPPLDAKVRFSWTLTKVMCGEEESTRMVSPSSMLYISGTSNTGSRTWNIDNCTNNTPLTALTTGAGNGSGTLSATLGSPLCISPSEETYCGPISALCEGREPSSYTYAVSGAGDKTLTLSADFTDDHFALTPCGIGQTLTDVKFIYTRP